MNIYKNRKVGKGLTGKWTKYGGRVYSPLDSQYVLDREWTCQSCGEVFPPAIGPYKYEYPKGEYIRCCSICFYEGCVKILERIKKDRI